MRTAAVAGVVFAVFGLATYEAVTLILAAVGMVAGIVALTWCAVNAMEIKKINDRQGERIDRLDPPGGG
jgi:hypothetical protein